MLGALLVLIAAVPVDERPLFRMDLPGGYAFLDAEGRMVVEPRWSTAGRFSDGRIGFGDGEKQGYLDGTGQVRIPARFDVARTFSEGRASVGIQGKYGFIDTEGREVTPLIHDDTCSFSEGLACVKQGGLWGYVDREGTLVIPPAFTTANGFVGDSALVVRDGHVELIDRTGRVLGRPGGPNVRDGFMHGLLPMEERGSGKWGFLKPDFSWGIPPTFEEAWAHREGRAPVKLDGKWGFIDPEGHVVVPPRFEATEYFQEGLCAVKEDGKWGFIDRTGALVIPARFDAVSTQFSHGLAEVELGPNTTWVRRDGSLLMDPAETQRTLFLINLASSLGGLLLAHLLGWLLTRRIGRPLSEWMPTLPMEAQGVTHRRQWRAYRDRVAARVLRAVRQSPTSVEARALAGSLSENPDVVDAILSGLAARLHPRMRVMSSGRVVYDFPKDALAGGVGNVQWWLLVPLLVLVNVAATWPLYAFGNLASGIHEYRDRLQGKVALAYLVASLLVGLFVVMLRPAGALLRVLLHAPGAPRVDTVTTRPSVFDNPIAAKLPAFVIAPLVMLVGVVLLPLEWLFQNLRLLRRREERTPVFPTLLPSNGLVTHVLRVLAGPGSERPHDPLLVERTLALAAARVGRVSALELALREGLALEEADRMLARLALRLGGTMASSTRGDLLCTFPSTALAAPADGPVPHETQLLDGSGRDAVPINLPGIHASAVRGVQRMAAGSAMFLWFLALITTEQLWLGPRYRLELAVTHACTVLLIVLAGWCAYAVRAHARVGVLRDVRRAVGAELLRGGSARVEALHAAVARAWPGVTRERVEEVVRGFMRELGGAERVGERLRALEAVRGPVTTGEGEERVVFESGPGGVAG